MSKVRSDPLCSQRTLWSQSDSDSSLGNPLHISKSKFWACPCRPRCRWSSYTFKKKSVGRYDDSFNLQLIQDQEPRGRNWTCHLPIYSSQQIPMSNNIPLFYSQLGSLYFIITTSLTRLEVNRDKQRFFEFGLLNNRHTISTKKEALNHPLGS